MKTERIVFGFKGSCEAPAPPSLVDLCPLTVYLKSTIVFLFRSWFSEMCFSLVSWFWEMWFLFVTLFCEAWVLLGTLFWVFVLVLFCRKLTLSLLLTEADETSPDGQQYIFVFAPRLGFPLLSLERIKYLPAFHLHLLQLNYQWD